MSEVVEETEPKKVEKVVTDMAVMRAAVGLVQGSVTVVSVHHLPRRVQSEI